MAVYKIPQDVEADDKFLGPLSFKQFIYLGIAVVACYLSFIGVTKGAPYIIALFAPIILVAGFLGWPWGREQPTEIWLAAKIRFMIKPRVRIWNQSGVKELVTITAPPKIEKPYTDGLNAGEVSSRLSGLADLLDSRGWAVKNAGGSDFNANLASQDASDRLVGVGSAAPEVTDVTQADDILDAGSNQTAIHFEEMIKSSEQKHRQKIINKLEATRNEPTQAAAAADPNQNRADFWFLQKGGTQPTDYSFIDQVPNQGSGQGTFSASNVVAPYTTASPAQVPLQESVQAAAVVTAAEQALLERVHHMQQNPSQQFGHLKTIMPLGQEPPASEPVPVADAYDQSQFAPQSYLQPNMAVDQPVAQPVAATPMPRAPLEPYGTTPWTPPVQFAPTYMPPLASKNQPGQTVTPPVDPAIINLASNNDLDVATLSRQANKKANDGEVVISLR